MRSFTLHTRRAAPAWCMLYSVLFSAGGKLNPFFFVHMFAQGSLWALNCSVWLGFALLFARCLKISGRMWYLHIDISQKPGASWGDSTGAVHRLGVISCAWVGMNVGPWVNVKCQTLLHVNREMMAVWWLQKVFLSCAVVQFWCPAWTRFNE